MLVAARILAHQYKANKLIIIRIKIILNNINFRNHFYVMSKVDTQSKASCPLIPVMHSTCFCSVSTDELCCWSLVSTLMSAVGSE